ncbi:MAG: Asp-tRNA(Asn)/Glu-tRNA(Gln) amidotransferase subunit GatA [Candidatus Paceibacterota bacterium]
MINLKELTIKEARRSLEAKEFSAVDLASAYLEIIKEKNSDLNAYLEIYDDVIAQAEEADKKIANGEKGELLGIPLAIKDNILIKGKIATAASKILENYIATYDATVIEKLKKSGAIFMGRCNMDEFAMGGSTENSAFGPTKNPYDSSRVAGGSSGGSIASVASDMALGALGTDTGGSIRQPAAFCGVVGMKPSYGRVSRYGAIAMGSSFDQIGPVAKTIEDAEILFKVIEGKDDFDSTSKDSKEENLKNPQASQARAGRAGKKIIGVPRKILETKGISEEVLKNFNESIEKFRSTGYEIVDIELPRISYSLPVYYILMPAEVSSNMARFDGVKFGSLKEGDSLTEDYMKTRGELLGKEVRRRILLGTYVLSAGYYDAYYGKAQKVRSLIKKDFEIAFEKVDVILMPTTPNSAFKIGEKTADPIEMYLEDIFTVTANLIGAPAISIPSGNTSNDLPLPLGIQLIAPYMQDEILFEIGKDFEHARDSK